MMLEAKQGMRASRGRKHSIPRPGHRLCRYTLHHPSSSETCSLCCSRLSRGSLVVARMGLVAGAGPPDPTAVL